MAGRPLTNLQQGAKEPNHHALCSQMKYKAQVVESCVDVT
jgi:hypothetical protein